MLIYVLIDRGVLLAWSLLWVSRVAGLIEWKLSVSAHSMTYHGTMDNFIRSELQSRIVRTTVVCTHDVGSLTWCVRLQYPAALSCHSRPAQLAPPARGPCTNGKS